MEENKKPGQRDISDLKARLGLKKPPGGPPGASGGGSDPAATSSGGTPSPMGGAPSAPADPKRDPFASAQAANLAAYYNTNAQSLPGSMEGVSASLGEKKPWGRIGFLAGAGLVVFIIGAAWGSIRGERINVNMTIDQAAMIKTQVEGISKDMKRVAEAFAASPDAQKKMPDPAFAAKLGALNLTPPETNKIFHTDYYYLENVAIDRLMTYYNDTIKLEAEIKRHVQRTEADKQAIADFLKNGAGKSQKNFGVTLDFAGAIPLSHFVELGTPVCQKDGVTDCKANELKGFKFRTDSGSSWSERNVKGKPQDGIYPIQPSPLFTNVAAGDPNVLAARDCVRRQDSIIGILAELNQIEKQVIGDLQKAADKPHVFAF